MITSSNVTTFWTALFELVSYTALVSSSSASITGHELYLNQLNWENISVICAWKRWNAAPQNFSKKSRNGSIGSPLSGRRKAAGTNRERDGQARSCIVQETIGSKLKSELVLDVPKKSRSNRMYILIRYTRSEC